MHKCFEFWIWFIFNFIFMVVCYLDSSAVIHNETWVGVAFSLFTCVTMSIAGVITKR